MFSYVCSPSAKREYFKDESRKNILRYREYCKWMMNN